MKTNFSLLSLLIIPFAGVAVASTSVTYDFDSSSVGDYFTNGGVSGWTQSNSNPTVFDKTFPLA